MKVNWANILERLKAYPISVNRLLPPCPEGRIDEVQADMGRFPEDLVGMLEYFNGAELFANTGPLVSIFGVSALPPLPPMEWAPEWCVDKFTPRWRAAGGGRQGDWAIAMMNYGGLIIMHSDGSLVEWDTAQRTWGAKSPDLAAWFEEILRDGDAYMREI